MSYLLKMLALMALAITLNLGVLTDAEAGPCKRIGEVRNKKGRCETVPTVQRRAAPVATTQPTPQVTAIPNATVLPTSPVVTATAPPPRPGFTVGTSMPTVIPASYVPGQLLDSCNGPLVINGVFTPQFTSFTSNVRTFGYHRSNP